MTYDSRSLYFYRIKEGGVRKFQGISTEARARSYLKELQQSAWRAKADGYTDDVHEFEARTIWGEVVEL